MRRRLQLILWPAFLAAAMLEMLVFAVIDPSDILWQGHQLGLSRQAVYTLAFFAFWAICLAGSAITALLSMPAWEVNHQVPAADS